MKYLLTLLCGFGLASAFFIFVDIPHREDDARRSGEISTKRELALKLPNVLGDDFQKSEAYESFFTVKDMYVVVVERNGVKTLRLYKDTQKSTDLIRP
jgi:hypothetical protein